MAPPADLPTTITLRIKVPPGHIEGAADEFTLGTNIQVSARIGEIRERIQQLIPSNPAPERQRLLYAGRALVENEQTLGDALNIRRDPTQTEFVIHLLVKGDSTATGPGPNIRNQSARTGPATAPASQPQLSEQEHGQRLRHDVQQDHGVDAAAALQQHNAHLAHILAGQGQQGQGALPLGVMPPAQHFAHHGLHGLPAHFAPHLPHLMPQPHQGFPGPHTDGTAERRHAPAAGLPDQHQRSASQPPPRPQGQGVILEGRGPNGERFQFQQHHIQLGHHPYPPALGHPHIPHFAQQQPVPRRTGPSVVEQARDNLTEMRRMLDELRELDGISEEQRNRIDRLQQRRQQVYNFVDPFNLGGSTAPAASALNNARAANAAQGGSQPLASSNQPPAQGVAHASPARNQQTTSSSTSDDVTAYLLSSPTGPQAILYSPQHGTYTGRTPPVVPQPTRTAPLAATNIDQQAPANNAQDVAAPPLVPQAAPAQDNLGALGPLINHMWLLMRVLIFAYFILGANLGWRRPLAMLAIAVGFWLLRQGPLGEGGILRRWWDGIVNQGQQRAVPGQQQGQAQVRQGQMPTPAQVAQRLLDEDRRQRNHGFSWLREQLRPAERALALLVASLWPGVGEAYVRALEAEERRRNEEEVAARRREEEERQQREEEEKKRAEEAAASSTDKGETSDVGALEADTSPEAHEEHLMTQARNEQPPAAP